MDKIVQFHYFYYYPGLNPAFTIFIKSIHLLLIDKETKLKKKRL